MILCNMKLGPRLSSQTGMPSAHLAAVWMDNPAFWKDRPSHRTCVCSQHLPNHPLIPHMPSRGHAAHSGLHTTALFLSTGRKGLEIQVFTQSQMEKPVADRIGGEGGRGEEEKEEEELVEEEGSHQANIYSQNQNHKARCQAFSLCAVNMAALCPPRPFRHTRRQSLSEWMSKHLTPASQVKECTGLVAIKFPCLDPARLLPETERCVGGL